MKHFLPAVIAITGLAVGCTQNPSTDINRLVAQSVARQPAAADESLETLARTDRSIAIAMHAIDANIANAETAGYKSQRVVYQADATPLIRINTEQGSMRLTGAAMDVAIVCGDFCSTLRDERRPLR